MENVRKSIGSTLIHRKTNVSDRYNARLDIARRSTDKINYMTRRFSNDILARTSERVSELLGETGRKK